MTEALPGDMLVVKPTVNGMRVFVYTKGPNKGSDGFFINAGSVPLVLSYKHPGDELIRPWCYVLVDGNVGWMCVVWIAKVLR